MASILIEGECASQSRNSKSCAISYAFVLGMMVSTIGLLTVQHYGLGDASFTKFFLLPTVPREQSLATARSAGAHVSSDRIYDLSRALPATIHQPILPNRAQPLRTALLGPSMSMSAVGSSIAAVSRPLIAAPGGPRFSVSTIPPAASIIPVVVVICLCLLFAIPTAIKAIMPASTDEAIKRRNLTRRVFTGLMLGAVVSLWIFSGTWGFLTAFAGMAVVAQLEYYKMALQNGINPTWKLGTIGSIFMYLAAPSKWPELRDAIFPLTGTVTIVYLLLRRERKTPPTTMNDVATTFMGIYYFGFMPSFWIRLRSLGPMPISDVLALFPKLALLQNDTVRRFCASCTGLFTVGAVVQWWTMLSIVAADIAAFFTGRRFGKRQLIQVSPNKTVEGFIGGCVASVAVSMAGASLMAWPMPLLTGCFYGLMCAVMGLIGDLTVSLLKRSAQVKDTGSLLPGHGGLLDRLDSFLLAAAPAYFFVKILLPRLN